MKPRKSRVAPPQGRSKRIGDMAKPPVPGAKVTVKVINGITHIRSRLDDGPRWIPVRVKVKK